MVDNFRSAGTQDDEEMPSPYGTGPSNRTTEEHRRSDYDSEPWRDRPNGLGLDPAPSLPNAPRQFERGPVPQQPYVPKPPYLPGSPPAPPPPQQRYGEQPPAAPSQGQPRPPYGEPPQRPEYYGEREQQARSDEQSYGQPSYPQESPFRPQQPPAQPPAAPNRQSPFAPTNGSNGVPPNRQGAPSQQPPLQPPRPPAAPQSSNGLTQHAPPPASNGSTNWSSQAPQQNGTPPNTGALPLPPQAPSNGLSPLQPPSPQQQPPTVQSQSPLQPPTPPQPSAPAPQQNQAPAPQPTSSAQAPAPQPSAPSPSEKAVPPGPSYLSDPSAEYESNAPVSEPRSRIGARRRADVQQDAPSQVPAEHIASHRAARRAQPTATAGTPEAAESSVPSAPSSPSSPSSTEKRPAEGGGSGDAPARPRRYRIHHLRDMKNRGEKWAMLTAYDQYTAEIFDQAGIPVLLVGDSAANNVFGYDTTLRVTVDELIPLARAVANAADRALVVADLPFGSYQASPEQAFHTAVRFMKEAGVHAVKLEGGRTVVPMVEKLTQSGIPVMAHIGFTPQSEHSIGGYRVQGRGDQAAGLIDDAVALAEAGAFSLVLEMVPGDVAAEITKRVPIPTVGIGAGRDTDAQVLVWQDMAGLRSGAMPRFVKQYADLRGILTGAATAYAADVATGAFPTDDHTF
ncbi:3-methyl-2-oxobutanoate hydroxymethyltransferase [Kribbella sp. NPDC051587]|uniref:3-methyl-2-oxobutanoate hydroxymethyltransferase n=1 Tax=Kribbella sp. NPDC051587 TaxID=3364119 RepID=UPI0037A98500